ncbi:MAG: hypothetical protein ICV85_01360 [Tolypothrix sp. T3-bin4]|nr:hypothetical protein [Tolypothrix sp. T3-bin4]
MARLFAVGWERKSSLLEEDQQRKWRENNPVEGDVDAVAWHWHTNICNPRSSSVLALGFNTFTPDSSSPRN